MDVLQRPKLMSMGVETKYDALKDSREIFSHLKLELEDAADLFNNSEIPAGANGDGILLTADGNEFRGDLFGAIGVGEGELVFTTGMMGYQESLTDPSFAGQVLTFTYPLIGNYGIHLGKSESRKIWPRGVVVRHAMEFPDHRDSVGTVDEFLRLHGIPGIKNIDTRMITKNVRELGTVLCVFGPADKKEELQTRLAELTPPDKGDLVKEVSIDEVVHLNPGALDSNGNKMPKLAAIDCGIKYNILRNLCYKFDVIWCPPNTSIDEINSMKVDAVFCSNGPGDPAHAGAASSAKQTLADAVNQGYPVMGICLGHQLMGLASGLQTYKMKYGHRGANQPVLDLETGRVWITSQNHGFAVADPQQGMLAAHPSGACSESSEPLFDGEVKVRFVNANDRTVEGLDVVGKPVFTVQFHPEACPGPHDAEPLFQRFREIVDSVGGAN